MVEKRAYATNGAEIIEIDYFKGTETRVADFLTPDRPMRGDGSGARRVTCALLHDHVAQYVRQAKRARTCVFQVCKHEVELRKALAPYNRQRFQVSRIGFFSDAFFQKPVGAGPFVPRTEP